MGTALAPSHHAAPDLCVLGATELAARIAAGEVTATAAVEAYIARLEAVNPRLNALVVPRFAEARAEAGEVDRRRAAGEPLGPLAGVPVTIKESLALAGTPASFGVDAAPWKTELASEDEPHVARLRAAGAIVLGKTNVAQLLLMIETDNPVHGRTSHPADPERSPGGSSGGEGALLAAQASALGLGTDLGGSVRVPAAFCGVVAIKPTTGRCDDLGRGSCPVGQRTIASQVGVLGRSVADVARGLEVINGGARPPLDGTLAAAMPLLDPGAVELARLRVAFFTDDGTFAPAPAVRRGVREAVATLQAAGARVTGWTPPDTARARDLFHGILGADGGAGMRRTLGRSRRDRRIAKLEMTARSRRVVDLLLAMSGRRRLAREVVANYGRTDTDHYWRLVEAVMDYRRAFARALGDHDVIVCPAAPLPAFRHGAAEELVIPGTYTTLFNVLGWPAGVVPVTRVRPDEESDRPASRDPMDRAARDTERGSAGLPIAVQVAARPWREDLVLAVMSGIERG
jgi:fatty acid amide hydrolase